MSKAADLLLDIASELNGYRIGEPWRFHELSLTAVIPISREVDGHSRGYRLLSEVKDVRVKDTGSIDRLEITNKSGYVVLVKAGEYVEGATQSRVLAASQIIFSEEKVVVPCVCIYSSRGIRPDQQVKVGGYAPTGVRRVVYDGYRSGGIGRYGSTKYGYSSSLQQRAWSEINSYSRETSKWMSNYLSSMSNSNPELSNLVQGATPTYHAPTEDLAGRVEETQAKLKEVLKKVAVVEDQVGICLVNLEGVESLESFEHPDSWKALRDSILKAEANKIADLSNRDGLFEFRSDKAKGIVKELLTSKYEEKVVIGKDNTQTIVLESERFQGEVVTLYDEPIHCTFMKRV